MPTTLTLPTIVDQAEHLIDLGVTRLAGLTDDEVRTAARASEAMDSLLVVDPALAPASRLTPLLRRDDKPGFVVVDMPDVDEFTPTAEVTIPASPLYTLNGVTRGDEMQNWSPEEALPAITAAGRSPLTLTEGIHWVLQQPGALERNECFMTIGSRLRKAGRGFDTRTPAVWISNGTGRDGRGNRNAPKIGWCWWGNRHTWLGFASTTGRSALA